MTNLRSRIIDVLIYFFSYAITLTINLFLGFGRLAFGNLVYYSAIFCLIECVELFFLNKKLQFLVFLPNVYVSHCLTGLFLTIVQTKDFFGKIFSKLHLINTLCYHYYH